MFLKLSAICEGSLFSFSLPLFVAQVVFSSSLLFVGVHVLLADFIRGEPVTVQTHCNLKARLDWFCSLAEQKQFGFYSYHERTQGLKKVGKLRSVGLKPSMNKPGERALHAQLIARCKLECKEYYSFECTLFFLFKRKPGLSNFWWLPVPVTPRAEVLSHHDGSNYWSSLWRHSHTAPCFVHAASTE